MPSGESGIHPISNALRPFGNGQTVAADDTVSRSLSLRSFDTTDLQFEANAIHEFSHGPTDWRVLAGGDVRRTTIEDAGPGRGNIVDFDTIDVFDPKTSTAIPSLDDPRISFFSDTEQQTDTYGFYAQVDAWIHDRLKLLAGARYTALTYEYEEASGFRFEESPDSFDPRVGRCLRRRRRRRSTPATAAPSSSRSASIPASRSPSKPSRSRRA